MGHSRRIHADHSVNSMVMQASRPVVARPTRTAAWSLLREGEVIASASGVCRPDRRWFVSVDAWRNEEFEPLVNAMIADLGGDLYTRIEDSDADALELWSRFGFVADRREVEFVLSPDPARTLLLDVQMPRGLTLLSAADVDEAELRGFDDRLRDDVPGTDGWINDPGEFHDYTFDEAHFDPSTYLVALDEERQQFAGLARIWVGGTHARLGLIGVARAYRRQGLARALLARALYPVHERGILQVTAEVDDSNAASLGLIRALGGVASGSAAVLKRSRD